MSCKARSGVGVPSWRGPVFGAGLLLLSLATARSSEDARAEYERCLREGAEILRAGDASAYPTAQARFIRARGLRQDAGEPYYWLALIRSQRQEYSAAEQDARKAAFNAGDTLPEAYLLLGQLQLVLQRHDAAVASLEKAEAFLKDRLRRSGRSEAGTPDRELLLTRFNLARALYHRMAETPDYPEARREADMVRAQEALAYAAQQLAAPDAPSGLDEVRVETELYRGHFSRLEGDFQGARFRYDAAYRADKSGLNPEPLFRLGLASRRVQDYNHAFRAFDLANRRIERYNASRPRGTPALPYHAESYLQMGTLYLQLRDPTNAYHELEPLRRFRESASPRHPWYAAVERYLAETNPHYTP